MPGCGTPFDRGGSTRAGRVLSGRRELDRLAGDRLDRRGAAGRRRRASSNDAVEVDALLEGLGDSDGTLTSWRRGRTARCAASRPWDGSQLSMSGSSICRRPAVFTMRTSRLGPRLVEAVARDRDRVLRRSVEEDEGPGSACRAAPAGRPPPAAAGRQRRGAGERPSCLRERNASFAAAIVLPEPWARRAGSRWQPARAATSGRPSPSARSAPRGRS